MGIDLVSACVFCAAFMLGTDLSTPPGLTADMGLSYATLSRKYEYIPGHDETSDVTPKFVVIGIGNAIAPSGDLGAGTPASEWRLRFAVGPSHDEAARRPNVNYPDLVQVAAKGNGRYENFAALGRFRLGESDSVEAAVDRRSHKATDLVNIDLSDHSVSEERSLGAERLDGALGWRHRWNHFEAALAGRWARLTGFNATAGANMNNSGSIFGFDAEGRMHVQRWTAVLHFERLSGSAGLEEQYFPSFTQHNGSAPALLEAFRAGVGYSWPKTDLFVSATYDRQQLPWVSLAVLGSETVTMDDGFHPDSNNKEYLFDLSARHLFTPYLRIQASIWLGFGDDTVTLTDAVGGGRAPIVFDVKRRGDFGGGLSKALGSPETVLYVGASFLVGR